jgi:hypothetical protein
MRTWDPLDARIEPACLPFGSYTFDQHVTVPDWSGNWRLSLRPLDRQDRENLPSQIWIQYDLNDSFFHQINFEMNSGRGRSRLRDQAGVSFNIDDKLEMFFCAQDGFVPAETKVDWSESLRFLRVQREF